MKKTVFLFLITICFIISIENKVIGSEIIYQVNNSEFIVTSFKEAGVTGFAIEKKGVNPFYSKISDDLEHYFITGIKEISNYYVVYGYGFTNNSDTEYDSLFFILDFAGNVVKKDLRDFGNMDTIIDVYYVDDTFITCTESLIDIDQTFEFNTSYFTSYDYNFNYLDTININQEIYMLNTNGTYILVGYGKEEYDIGIRSDLTFIQKAEITGINEGEIYNEAVEIEFINGATLNNDYIENGITVSYPGNYTLNHNNNIYNFTLSPQVTGVSPNAIYNESVIPVISGGNIMLNNDIYLSNTEISKPGHYDLVINGANNFNETLSFTITSNVEGIINNSTYTDPVKVSFNGDGYLNNQFIESPIEVSESGEYILKIRGENNYLETYYFSIQEEVNRASIIDFIQRIDIFVLVVVLISGGIILKKK